MGTVPDWVRENHAKTSANAPKHGIVEKPIFHSEPQPVEVDGESEMEGPEFTEKD